ncbi:MAG: hypothetical protein LC104_10685 [Bacteroidales bacterium]|nr:hypothetical protein [Bacteroidales bacterium]
MLLPDRREFLATSAALLPMAALAADTSRAADLAIAPFRFDVTPPMGHPLCGGWIKPVVAVDDPLEAIGFVLTGAGKPIVLCAVDWTGLLNEAHVAWRTALAEAAGTTPDRVAVQCVHQHNAPFACLDAERMVLKQGDLPHIVELDFYRTCLDRGRKAVAAGLKKTRRVTHVASGQARVDKVASNRRIKRDASGKVIASRASATKSPELRALPEGTIDPNLRTVAFFDKDTKIAACHYYATHPMSYYGDGRVSSDFVGLARKQRQQEEPDCTHIYFTGCSGNVTAGKYNDGSHEQRPILAGRMHDAIVAADKSLKRETIGAVTWKTQEVLPPPRGGQYTEAALKAQIEDKKRPVVGRNRVAYEWAYIRRAEAKTPPIVLSSLQINDIAILHLPAESFVEYQLRAQKLAPSRFVATAAYGDGGPWYIPTAEEYQNGGYEVSVAFCAPDIDQQLTQGMTKLLKG